jgi:tetratricopeptide (TPR) repeat protein
VLCALVLCGCSTDSSQSLGEGSGAGQSSLLEAADEGSEGGLLTLPEPDLSALESEVREVLSEARVELKGLSEASSQELADGFGELGMLYLAHALMDPAVACFENARSLDSVEFRWPYLLGRAALGRNDREAAESAFEAALALRSEHAPTLLALGRLALDMGAAERAGSYFGRALEANPASAAARAGLGRVASEAGDFETAARLFEEALELQPEATALHYSLALAYRESGDLERARRHLERRGEGTPVEADALMAEVAALTSGARVHLLRAGRALSAGRLERGISELRRAAELDPNDPTVRVTLGAALAQRGDRTGARVQLESALRLAPREPRAHYNLGLLAAGEGDNAESVRHFESALSADPGHARAAYQLGEALIRTGREAEGIAALERARELEPGNETVRLREVTALVAAARYEEAKARLEEGTNLRPDSTPIKHALARLLAAAPDPRVRDGERALALATEVATEAGLFEGRIDFDHGQTLALAYAEARQFDRAVALQEALVAVAERDGRTALLPGLQGNLERYRSGASGRLDSLGDNPFLAPAPFDG